MIFARYNGDTAVCIGEGINEELALDNLQTQFSNFDIDEFFDWNRITFWEGVKLDVYVEVNPIIKKR